MVINTAKMTAQQFLQMGEDPPGLKLELVDGEVSVSASPIPAHSFAILRLIVILSGCVDSQKSGELYSDVDTILDRFNVRRPDVLYFSNDRLHLIGAKSMEGPPDLAVEVISPSSEVIDKEDKFEQYAQAGVMHYWIVDPSERTAISYRLDGSSYAEVDSGRDAQIVRFQPFPELDIPLARLWQPRR